MPLARLPSNRSIPKGFALLEVVIAAAVLLFGIVSALTVLQSGLQAVDSARNYTKAAQLMQNEVERLRLNSWSQLEALQAAGDTHVDVDTRIQSHGTPFTCTRTIRDLKTDMKEITLESTWRNYDGRPQRAELVTRYSKAGLYDYLYTDTH
jgi:Tfp pilus assembly protein PilV